MMANSERVSEPMKFHEHQSVGHSGHKHSKGFNNYISIDKYKSDEQSLRFRPKTVTPHSRFLNK